MTLPYQNPVAVVGIASLDGVLERDGSRLALVLLVVLGLVVLIISHGAGVS